MYFSAAADRAGSTSLSSAAITLRARGAEPLARQHLPEGVGGARTSSIHCVLRIARLVVLFGRRGERDLVWRCGGRRARRRDRGGSGGGANGMRITGGAAAASAARLPDDWGARVWRGAPSRRGRPRRGAAAAGCRRSRRPALSGGRARGRSRRASPAPTRPAAGPLRASFGQQLLLGSSPSSSTSTAGSAPRAAPCHG